MPISFEEHVLGVIVLSVRGRDQFGPDDETTLQIFAGYAAQAIVNSNQLEQLDRQRRELEHQLASQRQLLDINERLISTRDPKGVLEMIADSLKAIVPYDTLTIYRCDFDTGRPAGGRRSRPLRRGDPRYEGPIGVGITGWVIDRGEGVLANDAHVDPRSVQIPGTPFEPESMIVVPVRVGGRVVGHAERRADGRGRGVVQPERVRARPAVRGPGVARPRERGGPRRGHGPGRARRADGPPQPRRVPARARRHGASGPRARRSAS